MTQSDSNQFEVNLNTYSGPLDVLLDLAKSQKVNLENISVTKLADQFHDFITKVKNLNLELLREEYYFIRPAYKFRFNYETKRNIFFKIPILGDMFTNGMLFLLRKRD